jgi:Zn-dependent M28 family amino/carboxypeptidase
MHRLQAAASVILVMIAPATAAEFSGESAYAYTQKVVAFGPRPPGSEAIGKVRAFIKSELRKAGARLIDDAFTASTPDGRVSMENVIGHFPGISGRALAVTGHYDTKRMPGFVGANDGGSSTGFLLELARSFSGRQRRDDIYLVFFDGEEAFRHWTETDSLYGSRHLAERWAKEGLLTRLAALINVDMIGDRNLSIVNEAHSTQAIKDVIWRAAADLGLSRYFAGAPGALEDDHIPFLLRGVPAADLIDFDYGPGNQWWHTDADTLDKLAPSSFEVVGKVVLEALRRLGS